ncbi:hypothetical protein BP00DRAFT_440829 [Aspergillus indologenus CBS 114.80]|uniref:FMN-dependent dehydrogenase domain-containing protein n=1 Tax=Aspergillus indologenus CBS 114.80 TaxID=1450541 RepID=A0A2V5I9Z1_9EURO|nr:hypothetical protein BP00DRAFT_440829 [Aspergillus indologenus CBS 114.80]
MSQTYGNYQFEIYSEGATSGVTPTVTTDPHQLEEQAKTALEFRNFTYVAGGVGETATMGSNQLPIPPVGVQSIFHEDKGTKPAETCGKIGVPYILSTASSSSIADTLFWPRDDNTTLSLLIRINGLGVLLITLDIWSLAWQSANLDNAYVPFIKGIENEISVTDPVFRAKFREESGLRIEEDIMGASRS